MGGQPSAAKSSPATWNMTAKQAEMGSCAINGITDPDDENDMEM
jgi:hypothetical protein